MNIDNNILYQYLIDKYKDIDNSNTNNTKEYLEMHNNRVTYSRKVDDAIHFKLLLQPHIIHSYYITIFDYNRLYRAKKLKRVLK